MIKNILSKIKNFFKVKERKPYDPFKGQCLDAQTIWYWDAQSNSLKCIDLSKNQSDPNTLGSYDCHICNNSGCSYTDGDMSTPCENCNGGLRIK